jgi:protein TonB
VSLLIHIGVFSFINHNFDIQKSASYYKEIPINLRLDTPEINEDKKQASIKEKKKVKILGGRSEKKQKAYVKPQFGISPQSKTKGLSIPVGNSIMLPDSSDRRPHVKPLSSSEVLSSQASLDRSSIEVPEYTEDALSLKIEGTFILDVFVDDNGKVLKAELKNRIGHGMDERLIESAKKAKFFPAKDHFGKNIAVWAQIKFRLELP